ncbi:hypothetical protein GOV08_01440 [Candidatus Woesearchaeota archaeon]|nr:hypothetical protein [Candidatus Woesearchaeota archaeon]
MSKAKGKRRQQSGARAKKKTWIPIIAPKLFREQIIGETPVIETSKAVGKIVSSNMMTLTGNIRKQSITAKLLITEVKEGKAYSKLVRYEISPPSIKRQVRRRRDRIDDSLVYKTSDGVKVRLKPFLLTRSLSKSSVRTEIRKRVKVFLFKKVSQITYDSLIESIINNKLQREMKESLSKVFPIRNADIRVMYIEKDDVKITPAPSIKEKPKEAAEESQSSEVVSASETKHQEIKKPVKKEEKKTVKEKATQSSKVASADKREPKATPKKVEKKETKTKK